MSDDDDTESAELEDFGGDDLPPPSPPPSPSASSSSSAAPPAPPPPELVKISKKIAASSDNLEMQALLHAALCASIADVLQDDKISAAERRRELRTISAAAAKCFPYRRLFEAEQLIKQDQAALENKKRERSAAVLEKRALAGGAKVIPIRGSAVKSRDPGNGIE